jgi:hypothetical protein
MKIQYLGFLPFIIMGIFLHYIAWKYNKLGFYDMPEGVFVVWIFLIFFWMMLILAGIGYAIT